MPRQPAAADYRHLFQDWEIGLVESLAHRFLDQTRIAGMDFEDLKQELFLKLWKDRDAYQAEHGSQATAETFFYKVLFRRALDILKGAKRKKRIVHTLTESWIEEDLSEEASLPNDIADGSSAKAERERDLKADLNGVLDRLSSEQKTICEMLMSGTPKTAVAKELGIHRDTLYERIGQMRRVLYQAQLDEYLKGDPTPSPRPSYKTSRSD